MLVLLRDTAPKEEGLKGLFYIVTGTHTLHLPLTLAPTICYIRTKKKKESKAQMVFHYYSFYYRF